MIKSLNRISDVAQDLRVSESTVKRLIKDGLLGTVKVGRSVAISRDELDRFVHTPDRTGGVKVAGKGGSAARDDPAPAQVWPATP